MGCVPQYFRQRIGDPNMLSEFDSGTYSLPMHPFEREGGRLSYDTVPFASERSLQGSCSFAQVSIESHARFSTVALRLPSRAVVASVLSAWCVPQYFRMRLADQNMISE